MVTSRYPLRHKIEVIDDIVKSRDVYITVEMASKTSLFVLIGSHYTDFLVSDIPAGCEDLKFHEKYHYSFLSDESRYIYRFKVLKNQKWDKFLHYAKCLIMSLNLPEMDELNVHIIISQDAKEKLEAPEYNTNLQL